MGLLFLSSHISVSAQACDSRARYVCVCVCVCVCAATHECICESFAVHLIGSQRIVTDIKCSLLFCASLLAKLTSLSPVNSRQDEFLQRFFSSSPCSFPSLISMKQLQHTAPIAWEAHCVLVAHRELGFGVCKELPGLSSVSTPQYTMYQCYQKILIL